ncbi:hypothetical protein [Microbulbifer magnicolonia]|uniref:hypothetical protein n=1 Tax=Microbulbifer magnicolonia TaxID=3109744 RepID=UPI002B40808A|nr:hypothetical protein [Microbulbifer sp. GG15]
MKSLRWFPLVFFLVGALSATAATVQQSGGIIGQLDVGQARAGEWIQLFVCRGEKVKAGQKLAVQRNAFGKVVLEYVARTSGKVAVSGRMDLGPDSTILEIGTVAAGESCAGSLCQEMHSD